MKPTTIDKYSAKHKGQNVMDIMDYARVLQVVGLADGQTLTEITEIKDDKECKRYLSNDLWDQRD